MDSLSKCPLLLGYSFGYFTRAILTLTLARTLSIISSRVVCIWEDLGSSFAPEWPPFLRYPKNWNNCNEKKEWNRVNSYRLLYVIVYDILSLWSYYHIHIPSSQLIIMFRLRTITVCCLFHRLRFEIAAYRCPHCHYSSPYRRISYYSQLNQLWSFLEYVYCIFHICRKPAFSQRFERSILPQEVIGSWDGWL